MYIVSRAKTLSGTEGPIINRHRFNSNDKPIMANTISNTVSNIEISPLGELRSAV